MPIDILNISLGFIEGFALIISPCILPILPIIFAGSLTGSKKRPIGIIIGFILIFSLFTFFSRLIIQHLGIDLNLIRPISFALLLMLGVIMLSTYLTEKFSLLTQRLANAGSTFSIMNNPESGWLGGILFGGLIAVIWTPCAGPILAAIIVQTVIQQTSLMSFLTLFAFATGAAIPMLIIAMFGRAIVSKLNYLKTHAIVFRKILGAIIILSVSYMIYTEESINTKNPVTKNNNISLALQNGLWRPYNTPSISGIDAWINSKPLELKDLKGSVVLIDFWTYSCINCMRTLPYLNDWYQKYHNKGLIIIGIHSPEFAFEKNLDNVQNAVKNHGIQYPVALDNRFETWQNFNNKYWPAHYLIDKNGYVVYTHFGEGEYDVTENNIRYLLGIDNHLSPNVNAVLDFSSDQTPETYLGYARSNFFSSSEQSIKNQTTFYSFPEKLALNHWALQGSWKIFSDKIISMQPDAALRIHFYARNVYIVMGSAYGNDINVKLLLNGKPLLVNKGKDVTDNGVKVNKHSLYEVISFSAPEKGILEIISSSPGLEVYTFTFG